MPLVRPPVPFLGQPSLLHVLAALPPHHKASPKLSLFSFTFTSDDLEVRPETWKHIEIGLQRLGMCTSMAIKPEVHRINVHEWANSHSAIVVLPPKSR